MSTTLAFLLRTHRVAAGLSQNRLAAHVGVDPAYINRLERGRHTPTAEVVRSVACALNLSDYDRAALFVSAGHWPWNLSPEDTRLIVELGGRISQAAAVRVQEQSA